MRKFDPFRKLFIDYGGKLITYLKVEVKDDVRAQDLFFRLNLKLIRNWESKPESITPEQWMMFSLMGEIRNYRRHLAKTDSEQQAKLKELNEQLYNWLTPYDDITQQIVLERALEFYTDESMSQSFTESVDIFETLQRAKAYFEEKKK